MSKILLTHETAIQALVQAGLHDLVNNPNDYNAQRKIGAILREQLVTYLREGLGVVAQRFRGDESWLELSDKTREQQRKEFLQNMSKSGFYGESFALPAFSELFNIRFEIQDVTQVEPYLVASEQTNKNAPLHKITHKSVGTVHFDIDGATAYPDGNCLFNCVAIALARTVFENIATIKPINSTVSRPTEPQISKGILINWQASLLKPKSNLNTLKREESEQDSFNQYIEGLKNNSDDESKKILQQIADDEKLAFKIAEEEHRGTTYKSPRPTADPL